MDAKAGKAALEDNLLNRITLGDTLHRSARKFGERTALIEGAQRIKVCPKFALGSGQAEIFPMTMYFHPDEQLRRFGNYWGQPCIVNELAIMDADGTLLGRGEVGEIVHRGPNVMLGYYKDPEATAQARRFGWHHTGDLGMLDDNGQLLFKDRMKDMIKTGGENVASVKVEEVLLRHPAVANAAVVGVPHPQWGEAIAAFVVLKPGAECDGAALQRHCRDHLAGFEVPKHVGLIEKMPTTSTGKIQKHVLGGEHQELFSWLPDCPQSVKMGRARMQRVPILLRPDRQTTPSPSEVRNGPNAPLPGTIHENPKKNPAPG